MHENVSEYVDNLHGWFCQGERERYQLEQDETTLIIGASSNALPLYEKMVTEQALYRAVAKNIGSDGRAESFFKQLLR